MRLFIAEKPSLGRAIAEGLGSGSGTERGGFIDCGADMVTWCFGHILEECEPEDYDPTWKDWRKLPVVPSTWRMKPKEASARQLGLIGDLLAKADSVVNAGDPDREGQLLVDEVLEHFAWQGPTQRIWLASLDARSVAKALAGLTDNGRYAPLRDAARARSRADWLIGINATRALTNLGRDAGVFSVLSLGRVQTPVLQLVVARDRTIAAFRPQDYMILQGRFAHPSGEFLARFAPGDLQPGLDAQGRLVDAAAADAVVKAASGNPGSVASVSRENRQKAPPLPHCLSSLQKAASARWGMTAQTVLDIAQRLYEKKLTTYPRTDCPYLPMEQFDDAGRVLGALAAVPGLEASATGATPTLKSQAWDTAKVTAHHAIIPTGETPEGLSDEEANLYGMIATGYIVQFHPPMRYVSQKIRLTVGDTAWETSGRHVSDPGWTKVAREDEEEQPGKEPDQSLPAVAQGDAVTCADVAVLKKKTTPPPRFTEGSLIDAMANIHRFVDDAAAKATLRENEGIGTEATRAGILETLKRRKYLTAQGKALVSTRLAGQVIDLTPPGLKDPVTTAQWETRLSAIAQGKDTLDGFMRDQEAALPGLLAPLLNGETVIKADGPVFPCPVCGKPLRLYERTSKRTGKPFKVFNCSGYPRCTASFFEKGGKPDFSAK